MILDKRTQQLQPKVIFVESNINLIDRGKSVVGIFTSNITLKIISANNVEISHDSEKSYKYNRIYI